jgi:hypothetical protein
VHGRHQDASGWLRVDRKTKRTIAELSPACRAVATRSTALEDADDLFAELARDGGVGDEPHTVAAIPAMSAPPIM